MTGNRSICKRPSPGFAYRLTYKNGDQKTQIVYVPKDRITEVKRRIKDYAKYREITGQIVEITIEMLRRKVKT